MSTGRNTVPNRTQSVVLASAILCCSLSFGQVTSDCQDKWLTRLRAHTRQLLSDEPTDNRFWVLGLACVTLARSGRADEAIQMVKQHSSPQRRRQLLTLVAGAQSESDDVAGALRTVKLLEDRAARQRALCLVVARQAQRGDFADATDLLHQITDSGERQRALELIIEAHLARGNFQDAAELIKDLVDPEMRGRIEERARRIRQKPSPDDHDYIERKVALAKKDMASWGFGEREEGFLRRKCRAEMAIHKKDAVAFNRAMRELHRWIKDWSLVARRNAMMDLASLYYRFGDQASARRAYQEVLTFFVNPGSAPEFDWVRIGLSTGDFFDELVQVFPVEDLEMWIGKLVDANDATGFECSDLIGGIVGAVALRGETDVVERMYSRCRTAQQRFYVCIHVVDAFWKLQRR